MKPLMKYHVVIDVPGGRRVKTWGVFPVSSTKILDGVYNPESKELSLLLDSVTEQYLPVEVPLKNGKYEVQQRKLDRYYQCKIGEADIPFFLETYVDNNFEIEPEIEEPKMIITQELT